VTDEDLAALGLERRLTTRHLVALTGFSRQGIFKMRERGELPAGERIGHVVTWPASVIREWLAKRPRA
jgi:predicted DNA-binding transcriptional regulator AlpA